MKKTENFTSWDDFSNHLKKGDLIYFRNHEPANTSIEKWEYIILAINKKSTNQLRALFIYHSYYKHYSTNNVWMRSRFSNYHFQNPKYTIKILT